MLVGRRSMWSRALVVLLLIAAPACPTALLRAVTGIDEAQGPSMHASERLDDTVDDDTRRSTAARASARTDDDGSGDTSTLGRAVLPSGLGIAGRDTSDALEVVREAPCRLTSNHPCGDRAPPAPV